jgi:protein-tyrosine phosphatase
VALTPAAGWPVTAPGVLRLPSGRLVRGRALRDPVPDDERPTFGLQLTARPPGPTGWEVRWVRWRDFGVPRDEVDAVAALQEAWTRCATERVEIGCRGGRGRTGTALAVLAVLDGLPADAAVAYVRAHYARGAVETPWQRRFVARCAARAGA